MKPALINRLCARYLPKGRVTPGKCVEDVTFLFSSIPYENFSKFLYGLEGGRKKPALRFGEQVIREHLDRGFGGTCFSLCRAACEIFKELGVEAIPATADMKAGKEIHSVVLLPGQDGTYHLIDPGYLVPEPIIVHPETGTEQKISGKTYRAEAGDGHVDLYVDGKWKYRVRLKEAGEERFLAAWEASFELMKDLIVTARRGDEVLYLRNLFFRRTGPEGRSQTRIREDYVREVSRVFSLPPDLVREAVTRYREMRPWKKMPWSL